MEQMQLKVIEGDAVARRLLKVLSDFKIGGTIRDISVGPVVSTYHFELEPGIRCSKLMSLHEDIARNLCVTSVRIAPIKNSNLVGIEVPNDVREIVKFSDLVNSDNWRNFKGMLPIALGKNIVGDVVIIDLAKSPHLLMAGTTGSGKSVGIHGILMSLLTRYNAEQCKLILVDPKMLELIVYNDIPHLLSPVITEPHKAVTALKWTVWEMERRYARMSKLSVRNIAAYNELIADAIADGRTITLISEAGIDLETGNTLYEESELILEPMPYIVVVIDEIADLMIIAGKEIEKLLQRLAQMARASGIHLVLATQRPSVDVLTGTIKANFPTRLSFMVGSAIDSRTIIGQKGAEQLLGNGDAMLLQGASITRVHGAFVDEDEVADKVEHVKSMGYAVHIQNISEETIP